MYYNCARLDRTKTIVIMTKVITVIILMLAASVSANNANAKKHKSDDSCVFNRGAADAAKCAADNCDNFCRALPGKRF